MICPVSKIFQYLSLKKYKKGGNGVKLLPIIKITELLFF
jgi:hypothetical protein